MVPPAGFEPTTSWSEARRSIQLSYGGSVCIVVIVQSPHRRFFHCSDRYAILDPAELRGHLYTMMKSIILRYTFLDVSQEG